MTLLRRFSILCCLLIAVGVLDFERLPGVQAQKTAGVTSQLELTSSAVTIRAARRGTPWVNFQDGFALASNRGSGSTTRVQHQEITATALAAADFDEDGVPDLVSAGRTLTGGRLVFYRGNVDSIYPNTPDAQRRRALGSQVESPFFPATQEFEVALAPDFVGAGDFDGDGHTDVAVMARGKRELLLVTGDGRGGLHPTDQIELPGTVMTAAISHMSLVTGSANLAIIIQSAEGSELLFLKHSEKLKTGVNFQRMKLSAADVVCTFGKLSDVTTSDLVLAQGRMVMVFQETSLLKNTHLKPDQIQNVPFTTKAVVAGQFTDAQPAQLAFLTDAGQVAIATPGSDAIEYRGQWPQALGLTTARVSSTGSDDLLVRDHLNQIQIVLDPQASALKQPGITPASPISIDVESAPIAILPMRLNADGLNDLVVLTAGDLQPSVVLTAPVRTFVVNSKFVDVAFDTNPGDGICRDQSGLCSLPAAIQEANASPGADLIVFNIAPGGPQISPGGTLFASTILTDTATIDGTTQPGFAGSPILSFVNPLAITAHNSVIRGLVLNGTYKDSVTQAGGNAIEIRGNTNIVEGNFLGTDLPGTSIAAIQNQAAGVYIFPGSSNNLIGGTTPFARNIISGNGNGNQGFNDRTSGIVLSQSTGNLVQGNYIGTDPSGTLRVGNFGSGITLSGSSGNVIGGVAPGASNRILFNYGAGVELIAIPSLNGLMVPANNSILRNVIHSNGLFGIDLLDYHPQRGALPGLTINDSGDGDVGSNGFQNYPALTGVSTSGGSTVIQGTLNSQPNQTYQIEIFTNDPLTSFQYEGQEFLGTTSVTTDGAGNATFTMVAPVAVPVQKVISATTTDSLGNTSEFSPGIPVGTVGNSFPPVIAVFDAVRVGIQAPATLQFNADLYSVDLDGSIVSYAWNFGDATTGSGARVSHTYTTPGLYTATLTVTDNQGNTASTSLPIPILGAPVPPNSLPAPSNLTATVTSRRITLRWQDNSTNETGFRIERAPKQTRRFVQVASLGANTTTFNQSVSPGTYLYRVRAFKQSPSLTSAYSNEVEVTVR